ncbi:helix-turn-helix transcriptional regulator [Natrinema marinum]|uniref:helix-turn-helix transcriptional regulator n=1 Tax=Natrinema marinum TaxID=2961598 RepID=UPI0020C8F704|nr:transcriptional regulator FilR1 domain-containing protein [Natrinema marinum]
MPGDETAPDPVELMRRSELLAALLDGPKTPNELDEETSLSRSTIHRALESLIDQCVLAETGNAFELTGLGRAVAAEITGCHTTIETAGRLRPLLEEVDTSAVTFPLEHLADAEVTYPNRAHAHATTRRIADLMADADRIRLFAGVISPIYLDMAYEQVRNGTEVAAIFDREVVEILFSEYGRDARKAARTGCFEVLVYGHCPFALFICDETVGIAAHDDDGFLRLFVASDDPDVFQWAESLYERYRDRSEYATLF